MPAGAIHVEPDGEPVQPAVEMREDAEEPLPISPLRLEHPVPTQQGGHPPREIQPLPMLTGGWDAKPLAASGPPPPQARVQGKPGLVLEDHRLSRAQGRQFFLTPAGTAGPLWLVPAGTRGWPASGGTPGGASTAAPVGLAPRSRSAASGAPPPSARPTARFSPNACGGCSRCRASACWTRGAKRVGRPGLGLGVKASSPAPFTPWIHRLRLMRVTPKTSAVHPGRCPSRRRSKAATFTPTRAPGTSSTRATRRSFVAVGCVTLNVGFLMPPA